METTTLWSERKDPRMEWISISDGCDGQEVQSIQRINFHQGALGHQTSKPTTVFTSMNEMFDQQGLVSKGSSKEWPSDLAQCMELSSSLASWASGLKNFLAKGINGVNEQSPALRVLWASEQRQL